MEKIATQDLSSYELFQLSRYGNILPNSNTPVHEIESDPSDGEAFAMHLNNHYESQLLNP